DAIGREVSQQVEQFVTRTGKQPVPEAFRVAGDTLAKTLALLLDDRKPLAAVGIGNGSAKACAAQSYLQAAVGTMPEIEGIEDKRMHDRRKRDIGPAHELGADGCALLRGQILDQTRRETIAPRGR